MHEEVLEIFAEAQRLAGEEYYQGASIYVQRPDRREYWREYARKRRQETKCSKI
jgi:hypothetical protein